MLFALRGEVRNVEEKKYYVTEILDPPQLVYLKRHRPYWLAPLDSVWMVFGSAIHSILQDGHEYIQKFGLVDRFKVEERFEVNLGDCILSGRSDLYDTEEKTLWDYKSTKIYNVKRMLDGDFGKYDMQMNIYRAFQYPEAERLVIEAIPKDWNEYEGVPPVVDIDVPLKDIEWVKGYALNLIMHHEVCNITGVYPNCTDEEIWFNYNKRSKYYKKPQRCLKYCPVASVCEQFKHWRECNDEES